MSEFIKSYAADAAVDIVMLESGVILPGLNKIRLPVHYKPDPDEVAMVSARSSTLEAGIFVPVNLIDPGYEGTINVWVFNCSGLMYNYQAGDRLFSIINLQLATTRVDFEVLNNTKRRKNNIGSSGGH